MSVICARPSRKEVGVKRVETLVSTLLPRRGARRIPAEVQRKTPRPLGANTLTQFEYPAQPMQKRSSPERANPPAAVRVSRSAGAEKKVLPGQGKPADAARVPRLITARKRKKPPYKPELHPIC